jgi:hypothetical protein
MIYILFNFLVKAKANKKIKNNLFMILNMDKVLNKEVYLKKAHQKIFKRNCMTIVICNQSVRLEKEVVKKKAKMIL